MKGLVVTLKQIQAFSELLIAEGGKRVSVVVRPRYTLKVKIEYNQETSQIIVKSFASLVRDRSLIASIARRKQRDKTRQ